MRKRVNTNVNVSLTRAKPELAPILTYTCLLESLNLANRQIVELCNSLHRCIAQQVFQKQCRVESDVALPFDQGSVHLGEGFERLHL